MFFHAISEEKAAEVGLTENGKLENQDMMSTMMQED